jgi:hypothetical protein
MFESFDLSFPKVISTTGDLDITNTHSSRHSGNFLFVGVLHGRQENYDYPSDSIVKVIQPCEYNIVTAERGAWWSDTSHQIPTELI